jgi:hypothetical protein
LRRQTPPTNLITIDNEHVVRGELPEAMADGRILPMTALPLFLRTYIDRLSFSFTGFLRQDQNSASELHQWIRNNYLAFRDLELDLIPQR